MARFHERLRDRLEALAGEGVRAVVVLTSITGSGSSTGSGDGVSYNAENAYVTKEGLDPELRIPNHTDGFGHVCALSDDDLHFFASSGNMRTGDLEHAWSSRRDGVELRHQRSGFPGMRTRLMHFTFSDGRYYVGSSSDSRIARNAMNDPREFLALFGPGAVDLSA